MKPNFILSRYLTKSFLLAFLSVLLMVLGVVLMFEIIELLRKVSGRADADLMFVLKMALTKMPRTIEMIFPFVIMISGMVVFWKFSKSNEFVVIRAAGVSVWGFLFPVLLATFIVGIINVTVVNPLSSKMYEVHETMDLRFRARNQEVMLFNTKGLWIREAIDKDRFMVLHSKFIMQQDDKLFLNTVSVFEMDRNTIPYKRLEAFSGELRKGYFHLGDIKVYVSGQPVEDVSSMDYKTSINLDRIKENFVEPDAISVWQLPDTIEFYEKSGFSAKKHYMRYLSVLFSPLLLCSMILVAAVFALRPNMRKGGVMLMIIGGISTGFIVYFMSQLVYAFGINGYIPVLLAVVSPFLIITLVSVSVLLHLEDG